MRRIITGLMICAFASACGTDRETPSSLSIDQNLSLTAGRVVRFREFYQLISPLLHDNTVESTPQRFRPSEVLPLQFTASEAASIDNAFPDGFAIDCKGLRCRGYGVGSGVESPLSKEIEANRIAMESSVSLVFRVIRSSRREIIEICQVDGVQLKTSFIWGKLDGGFIEYEPNSNGRSTRALMDVGALGSYPKSGC